MYLFRAITSVFPDTTEKIFHPARKYLVQPVNIVLLEQSFQIYYAFFCPSQETIMPLCSLDGSIQRESGFSEWAV